MTTIRDVLDGSARWCVVEGECVETMRTMPAECCDHIITDPPYEVEAHTKSARRLKDATQRKGARNTGAVRFLDNLLPFDAISKETRHAVGALAWCVAQRWVIAFCQIEAVSAWRDAFYHGGLDWVRGGVWRKPNGAPQFTGDRPGMGFECLAIAHKPGKKRWNGGGKHAVWDCPLDHHAGAGGRNEHATTKPLALMLQLIRDFTDPGEIILDPFCGSGTTGVACLRLGRRFIGIERKPEYVTLSRERIAAEEAGSTLQAARAGQVPMFGGAP